MVPRINVKLGGINVVPASSPVLTDPSNATIVMGMAGLELHQAVVTDDS